MENTANHTRESEAFVFATPIRAGEQKKTLRLTLGPGAVLEAGKCYALIIAPTYCRVLGEVD